MNSLIISLYKTNDDVVAQLAPTHDGSTYPDVISLPKPKTNYFKNSALYSASKLFNSLPLEIRTTYSINMFSRALSDYSFVTL